MKIRNESMSGSNTGKNAPHGTGYVRYKTGRCHLSCIEVMLVVSATSHGSVRMPADNENSAITHWE